MRKLFIDANIYLGFYNSNKPEFKKLLAALVELSDKILITHQIIDEVGRNKLNVFRASIDNYLKQGNVTSTFLPEHLDNDLNPKIKEWNNKSKDIELIAQALNKELIEILKDIISDISYSRDKASIELSKLFANPLKPLENTFKRARVRKEIGNPPGKSDDPIGDQLNWVQVLENLQGVSALWIVSNDYDYFTEFNKQLFLNPILLGELLAINPKIEIFVHNKLSEALKHFNSKEQIYSLPEMKELEKIAEEEPRIIKGKIKFYGGGHAIPIKCSNCKGENTFANGSYLRSQYGRLTYQYICTNCGFHYDTGDFWE